MLALFFFVFIVTIRQIFKVGGIEKNLPLEAAFQLCAESTFRLIFTSSKWEWKSNKVRMNPFHQYEIPICSGFSTGGGNYRQANLILTWKKRFPNWNIRWQIGGNVMWQSLLGRKLWPLWKKKRSSDLKQCGRKWKLACDVKQLVFWLPGEVLQVLARWHGDLQRHQGDADWDRAPVRVCHQNLCCGEGMLFLFFISPHKAE